MAVRIGLIGCGSIAEVHVNGYLKVTEKAQVTAVCDVSEPLAQQRAAQAGGHARIFSDYAALIAEGDVDAVDICLPHHLHKDAILAAAAAGKHILCEKPLCLNREEAQEISRAIKNSGVTMMCAHNQLYYTAVRRAKELIDDDLLGRVYEIR